MSTYYYFVAEKSIHRKNNFAGSKVTIFHYLPGNLSRPGIHFTAYFRQWEPIFSQWGTVLPSTPLEKQHSNTVFPVELLRRTSFFLFTESGEVRSDKRPDPAHVPGEAICEVGSICDSLFPSLSNNGKPPGTPRDCGKWTSIKSDDPAGWSVPHPVAVSVRILQHPP